MTLRTRLLSCVLLAALSLTALLDPRSGQGQDGDQAKAQSAAPDRPQEASVETIVADIDPEVRARIASQLQKEIELMQQQLESERKEVQELQQRLREQEAKVQRTDLTLTFLKDRLGQWSADQHQGSASPAADVKP